MALLRESDDFGGAIDATARKLGLSQHFVEKDYWVTEVLRALSITCSNGGFLLKGGTSLSKGSRLIKRFSEDVDIIITPTGNAEPRKKQADRLEAITEQVAAELGGIEWKKAREPGRGANPHRGDVILYPEEFPPDTPSPARIEGVLLETGFDDGDWPASLVEITSYVAKELGLDEEDFSDTQPFAIRVLKPHRTLIEKLSLLHNVACEFQTTGKTDPRCGRHFYDVYCLLQDKTVREKLADRTEFHQVVAHIESVSADRYGDVNRRPTTGFADSPAFAKSGTLSEALRARHAEAEGLHASRGQEPWPTFNQVLATVRDQSKNL